MATETYSIASDFGGTPPFTYLLDIEVRDVPALAAKFQGIVIDGDAVVFYFSSTLTGGEQTQLDAVVAAHTGTTTQPFGDTEALVVSTNSAPTVNADARYGFRDGSTWVNTATAPRDIYICTDATEGAAVWQFVPPASGSTNVGADIDFLLMNDPPEPNTDLVITRTGNLVTKLEFIRDPAATLLKEITYARSGGRVSQEVIKVFDTDGTTVLGQLQIDFTYSGVLTNADYTRIV